MLFFNENGVFVSPDAVFITDGDVRVPGAMLPDPYAEKYAGLMGTVMPLSDYCEIIRSGME